MDDAAPPVMAENDAGLFYAYMIEHHALLEKKFEALLDAMRHDAADVGSLWTEVDHGLLAHMEAEERYVLPAFARVDRAAAAELLREHGEIRQLLLELGVAVDLHQLRYERSQTFVQMLRAHAGREDNLLYRWADERLDLALRRRVLAHVGARSALA
ncbi:MAG: hemerythrin domain-containing protein [Kofleriaceae bacterium]|nr:hemerythrin domain-containing protein [Kofleriaceae bacterium]